jgi:hypothetical protein
VPQFDPGVGRCEVATCLGVFSISIGLPGTDFLDQRLRVGNAAVEALRGQGAEFGFGEIKPTAVLGGVVPFETLDQTASLDGRERFVKRGLAVDVAIILDEHDGLGVGKWMSAKAFRTQA